MFIGGIQLMAHLEKREAAMGLASSPGCTGDADGAAPLLAWLAPPSFCQAPEV